MKMIVEIQLPEKTPQSLCSNGAAWAIWYLRRFAPGHATWNHIHLNRAQCRYL